MRSYKIDFKNLKSKVGIDDIAFSLGYLLNRHAGVGRYVELILPDGHGGHKDAIVISHPNNKSLQTYFRRNDGKNGDVINFILENRNSFNISSNNQWDLVSKVLSKFANEPIQETSRDYYVNHYQGLGRPFDPSRYKVEPLQGKENTLQYLFDQRSLSKETVEKFSPWLVRIQDSHFSKPYWNLGFPYIQAGSEKVEGYEIRGSKGFKMKAAGTNSSTAAWIVDFSSKMNPKEISNVYFAESAYDIMAFYQANRARMDNELDRSVFVSIGGAFSGGQVKGIASHYPNARLVDCFDNDIPGRIYGMKLAATAEGVDFKDLKITEDDKHINVEYKGNKSTLDANKATLTDLDSIIHFTKHRYGVEKAPSAFKDWNDVVMNKPLTPIVTPNKYERDEKLRESRGPKL
jgi:hypothetical protein